MTHTDDHSVLLSTTTTSLDPLLRRLLASESVSPPTMFPIPSPTLLVRRLSTTLNAYSSAVSSHLMFRSYWYVSAADPYSASSQRRVVKCPKHEDTMYRRHSIGYPSLATPKGEDTTYRGRFVPHGFPTLLVHLGTVFNGVSVPK